MDTLWIFLNRSLLDKVEKNQKSVFKIRDFLPVLYIILNIRDSDWLNFIHFLGYKEKIRLVSILRKKRIKQ